MCRCASCGRLSLLIPSRHLLGQAGLKPDEADNGAATLIQRFGSAANFNIRLHGLVLDGLYRRDTDGPPELVEMRVAVALSLIHI